MRYVIAMFLMVLPATAQDDCAWNPNVVSDIDGGYSGPAIIDSPCLDVDPISVVWLESEGCQCIADCRILGRWMACDGQDVSTCEEFDFGYSIVGIPSGNPAALIGQEFSGTADPGNPPPVVFFDQSASVDCGGLFLFAVEANCSCLRTIQVMVIDVVGAGTGHMVAVTTSIPTPTTVCSTSDTLARFSAQCNVECDPASPPPSIPIQHVDQ